MYMPARDPVTRDPVNRAPVTRDHVAPDRAAVLKLAEKYTPAMVAFLRDMIAIPSESAEEREVIARARAEMERVGFDEIRIDGLGNLLGRIGSGSTVVALDAHIVGGYGQARVVGPLAVSCAEPPGMPGTSDDSLVVEIARAERRAHMGT